MKLDYMRYMFLCDTELLRHWYRRDNGNLCQWNAHLMQREDFEHFNSDVPDKMVEEGLLKVRDLSDWGKKHGIVSCYETTDMGKAYACRHLSLKYKKLHNKIKHLINKAVPHE